MQNLDIGIAKTLTFEGISVENVASQFGLHQVIKEPKHVLENSFSCIDLNFSSQPKLIVDSGTQPSLHLSCHHQIIYTKFNLKIHYPLLYAREVWHYKDDSNDDLIRRANNKFSNRKNPLFPLYVMKMHSSLIF